MKKNKRRRKILIVNDDGIYGEGLKPLARELAFLGDVTVVVPENERSAASQAITLHKPIRVRHLGRSVYIINGTPADCVRFGALTLLKENVDAVAAGINRGANMGADTLYSGTVGGAREAFLLGFPSVAVSLVEKGEKNYGAAAWFARRILKTLLDSPKKNLCLNVNVPDRPKSRLKGIEITRLGRRVYGRELTSRVDPRGFTYYWLAGQIPAGVPTPGSDMAAVEAGKISVTPLRLDFTDGEVLHEIRRWRWPSLRGKK